MDHIRLLLPLSVMCLTYIKLLLFSSFLKDNEEEIKNSLLCTLPPLLLLEWHKLLAFRLIFPCVSWDFLFCFLGFFLLWDFVFVC